jgi:hypothetical protein
MKIVILFLLNNAFAMNQAEKNKMILDNVPKSKLATAAFDYIHSKAKKCQPWEVVPEKSGVDHGGFEIKRFCTNGKGGVHGLDVEAVISGSISKEKGKPTNIGFDNINFSIGH